MLPSTPKPPISRNLEKFCDLVGVKWGKTPIMRDSAVIKTSGYWGFRAVPRVFVITEKWGVEMETIVEILRREGKTDGNGCAECPVCGERIPLCNGGPQSVRHIVVTRNGKVMILCPERAHRVMQWTPK